MPPKKAAALPVQKLRVWWIPQVPMKQFHYAVKTVEEARVLLDALAKYDIFQYEHNIKPDFANAGGLEMFEDGEWCEWISADGEQISDILD